MKVEPEVESACASNQGRARSISKKAKEVKDLAFARREIRVGWSRIGKKE